MTAPAEDQGQVIVLAVVDEPDPLVGVAVAALSDVYEQPFSDCALSGADA
jgi:hypothetical protein